MLDDIFATLVWLKKPLKVPDLPRYMIVADCYATLNPPDELWERYLEEIDRLQHEKEISEDDYTVLRHSIEIKRLLMDVTRGDPDAFVVGTIDEVLKRYQAELRADLEEAVRLEKDRRTAAEIEKDKACQALLLGRSRQQERLCGIARRMAAWFTRGLEVAALATLCTGVYFTIPDTLPRLPHGWQSLVPSSLILLVGVVGLLNFWRGATLKGWLEVIEDRLSDVIECFLVSRLLPGPMSSVADDHQGQPPQEAQ